jgi:hypothetical protein
MSRIVHWRDLLLCLAASTAIVAGCGGGAVGSGGTGAPMTSQGTVSGFGSVIVDGLAFDDRDARVEVEDAPGLSILAEARLGQRVEVDHVVDGVAQTIRIEAELKGTVSSVSADRFVALGQTVVVNLDAGLGPITQFAGGYRSFADVQAGDPVEVHGVRVLQAGVWQIQATRIERRLIAPFFLRVAGIVEGVNGSRFQLGALTIEAGASLILPAGSSVANGQRVVVFARPSQLTGSTLQAELVRIKPFGATGATADIAGVIAALDLGNSTFNLGGVTVRAANAQIDPPATTLSNGLYVRVRGSFAADGSLVATRVKLRNDSIEPQVELRGTIYGFDAVTQHFELRGVDVNAAGATVRDCGLGLLEDGLFVEVKGNLSLTGVTAQEVRCDSVAPTGAVIERRGIASAVNTTARTFLVTPLVGAPVAVEWTALTFFRDVTPATLEGASVGVDGVLVNGRLIAQRIRLRN